jgi:hypothetical protein
LDQRRSELGGAGSHLSSRLAMEAPRGLVEVVHHWPFQVVAEEAEEQRQKSQAFLAEVVGAAVVRLR